MIDSHPRNVGSSRLGPCDTHVGNRLPVDEISRREIVVLKDRIDKVASVAIVGWTLVLILGFALLQEFLP